MYYTVLFKCNKKSSPAIMYNYSSGEILERAWKQTTSSLEESFMGAGSMPLYSSHLVANGSKRFFHKGLHECFDKDYEHLFHSSQHPGVDVPRSSPIYMPSVG